MSNGFKFLRSVSTGRTGYYPAHFLGFPDFEEVVDDAGCVDCVVEPPAPEKEDEKAEVVITPAQIAKVKK